MNYCNCPNCRTVNCPNAITKPEAEGVLLRLLGSINIRRRSAQRELKDAIENKQWSKVPGWDGIDIGLMMAEKTIKEEMQQNAHGNGNVKSTEPDTKL